MEKRITVSDNGRIRVQTDGGVITENGEKIVKIVGDFHINDKEINKLFALQENRPLCSVSYGRWFRTETKVFNSNSEIESFFNSLNDELQGELAAANNKLDIAKKKISELESMTFWQRVFYKKDKK